MYPNNNQQFDSGDYLNQIAPKAPKKSLFSMNNPILIATSVVLILVISIIALNIAASGKYDISEQLAARLNTTESTIEASSTNIKNSQLKALNSSLKLSITNIIRDMTPILKSKNINISKLNSKIIAIESDELLLSRLEDARLNAIFDRTYAREISYKLSTVLTLISQNIKNTNNSDLKDLLIKSKSDLEPIQKQFAQFNSVNE